jgi:hypothetical protein
MAEYPPVENGDEGVEALGSARLADLVAELEQVHGPVTDDEVTAARSEWP